MSGGGGRERGRRGPTEGEREGRAGAHICTAAPTRHLERAAQGRGAWTRVDAGQRQGAPGAAVGAGLCRRGVRARALPAAPRARRGTPGLWAPRRRRPLPPARLARQPGSPGEREKARRRQPLGELFPPRLEFHRKHMLWRSWGPGGGGAGIFRSVSRGGSGPGPAGLTGAPTRRRRPWRTRPRATLQGPTPGPRGARGEQEPGGEGREPRRGSGVQPYLGGFPLECTSSYSH